MRVYGRSLCGAVPEREKKRERELSNVLSAPSARVRVDDCLLCGIIEDERRVGEIQKEGSDCSYSVQKRSQV